MRSFKVAGEKVILYHLKDGFYATQARCTHLFKLMVKGKILNGEQIQCPLHRAHFNIRTGAVEEWANFPPGVQLLNVIRAEKALKTYPVTIDNGAIMVEV